MLDTFDPYDDDGAGSVAAANTFEPSSYCNEWRKDSGLPLVKHPGDCLTCPHLDCPDDMTGKGDGAAGSVTAALDSPAVTVTTMTSDAGAVSVTPDSPGWVSVQSALGGPGGRPAIPAAVLETICREERRGAGQPPATDETNCLQCPALTPCDARQRATAKRG